MRRNDRTAHTRRLWDSRFRTNSHVANPNISTSHLRISKRLRLGFEDLSMLPDRTSLKDLVLRGSALTIAGHGTGQLIRLIRSLILTRLLFPEAFGVMSLVWAIMYGLEMLSDAGLGPAIIRDKRGDTPEFLNTAWTIQVIRGAVLWVISCLIAVPMAIFYRQPDLAEIIPVVGLTALIAGFTSTAVYTCRRHMAFGRLTVLELTNDVVGSLITVLLALVYPTVWALIAGMLISRLFLTLASHAFLPGIRNRLRWESSSVRALIGFGKWIYLSSAFYFISVQGDRLLLAHYLDMAQLGVYSIAITLSEAVQSLVLKINRGVLLPAYGNIVQNDAARLRVVSYRARLGIDVFLILPIAVAMIAGSWIVRALYDVRYQEAGWIFQILCVRLLMMATLSNSESCLVALGRPQYAFAQSACRAAWILVSIPIGWSVMGLEGVVWAVALSEVPVMAVLWIGLARHRLLSLSCELRSLLFVGLGVLLGIGLLQLLP